jgi:putative heme-binding domain-containing protein
LDCLTAINPEKATPTLSAILADASESHALRERAAQKLAAINRTKAQTALLSDLALAPAPLQKVIAESLASSPSGGEKLLDAIEAGKASERLLWEWGINLRLAKYPRTKDRLVKLTRGSSPADKRLQDLMQHRRVGFLASRAHSDRGLQVFEKSCANCHQVAGKGAKIGPQLDGVGVRGIDRLLEDIIDPNRNVDQAFRATTLSLKNGQIVTGLLLREEGEIYVLADSQGKEIRVAKADTEDRTVSQLSPMPSNLADQIPENEFYDLLAYLLSLRHAEAPKMK